MKTTTNTIVLSIKNFYITSLYCTTVNVRKSNEPTTDVIQCNLQL